MRISKLWPQSYWQKIWENLTTPISEADRAVCYRTIHDILPTNERLHRFKMSPTDGCKECGKKDTLLHRLTECREGQPIWEWTTKVIARMLRTIPARIPNEWLLRSQFYLWSPQRQRAVLWVLSRFVTFRLNRQRGPTLHDLMDFLRRSKWNMYQSPSRRRSVANFLTVLDATWRLWLQFRKVQDYMNGRSHDLVPRPRKRAGC